MDIIFQLEKATANEVMERLETSVKNATVRKQLSILVNKGFLRVEQEESKLHNRYYYLPAISMERARNTALDHLLDTFFEGSASKAVMAIVKKRELDLSEEEMQLIQNLIDNQT